MPPRGGKPLPACVAAAEAATATTPTNLAMYFMSTSGVLAIPLRRGRPHRIPRVFRVS
jgi:hypothetical protein